MAAKVVFFDLGDTLGTGQISSGGSVTRFDPFPFVVEILKQLKDVPLRLGVISNTPPGTTSANMASVLGAAGIGAFFDPALLLYSSVEGMDKTQKAFFNLAVSRAGVSKKQCVFVGEDAAERSVAGSAGLFTAFHPLHVFQVLKTIP